MTQPLDAEGSRWSSTNWKRLTSSSLPRNTWPPGAGCPARWSASSSRPRSSAFSASSRAIRCSGVSCGPRRTAPAAWLQWAGGQRPVGSGLLAGPERLEPVAQRAPHDAQVLSDAADRGPRRGLVQVDGLTTELIGVVLPGHGSRIISLSLPSRVRDSACPRTRVRPPAVIRSARARVLRAVTSALVAAIRIEV